MNSNTRELSRDEIFEVLSSDRRRHLIYFLESHAGEAELRELAQWIAARENGTDPEAISEQARKRVYISLYQTHLPKLETYGLVEYDSDEKRVATTERIEEVIGLFDESKRVSEPTFQWQLYYPLLAGGSVVLFVLHLLGVGITSTTWLTFVIVGSLLALSLTHYYVEAASESESPPSELL